MATKLSLNLNAIAMLRNRRDLPWPSVTGIGRLALRAGAHGLTVHPRPDERHIREQDVFEIVALIRGEFPDREYNIEGYPDARLLDLVARAAPDQVTLVPDDPSQATSDHGWDIAKDGEFVTPIIAALKAQGRRVSLFANADADAMAAMAEAGADRVEFYTGPYGACYGDPGGAARELDRLAAAAEAALAAGLEINAGHDLTLDNLPPLVARIPQIAEVSIGHGATADALIHGVEEMVRLYLRAAGN